MTQKLNNFAELLKTWRKKSGLSQLQLSLSCSVSQKHISFLELNRVSPSRSMVLAIGNALNLPPVDRNAFLLAAGFAPTDDRIELSAMELAEFEKVLSTTLNLHEPYPAVVVDEAFDVLRANSGARKLQIWLYEVDRLEDLPAIASNFLRGMFFPHGYRPYVTNWDDCAYYLYCWLSAQSSFVRARELLEELESNGLTPKNWRQRMVVDRPAPFLRFIIEKNGVRLNFFSTNTTFAWQLDSTLQEPYVRSVFPADDATRQFFESE